MFFHEQLTVQGFAALMFTTIPVSGLIISVQDYGNNWHKYEKVLSVSDNEIVLSKLMCYLIDMAIAFAFGTVFCGIAFSIDASLFDIGLIDAFSFLVVFLTIVVFIGALFYGGLYLLGIEKSDIWMIISIVVAPVITAVVAMTLNKSGVEKIPGLIIMLCISSLALVLSYFIASSFFRRNMD